MAHRSRTNRRADARKFRNTAMSTKQMNISPKIMRGGIRL